MLFRDYTGKLVICSKCGSLKKIVAQYTRNIDDYPPGPSYLLCKDCAIIKIRKHSRQNLVN
jgi:hypothetical protein